MAFTITAENWQQIDKLEELRLAFSNWNHATHGDYIKYLWNGSYYIWHTGNGTENDKLQNNKPTGGFNAQSFAFFDMRRLLKEHGKTFHSSFELGVNGFIKIPYFSGPRGFFAVTSSHVGLNGVFNMVNTFLVPSSSERLTFHQLDPYELGLIEYFMFYFSGTWWISTGWDAENKTAIDGFKIVSNSITPPLSGWTALNGSPSDIQLYLFPVSGSVVLEDPFENIWDYPANWSHAIASYGGIPGPVSIDLSFSFQNGEWTYSGCNGGNSFSFTSLGNMNADVGKLHSYLYFGEAGNLLPHFPPKVAMNDRGTTWISDDEEDGAYCYFKATILLSSETIPLSPYEYMGPWIIDELKTALAAYAP